MHFDPTKSSIAPIDQSSVPSSSTQVSTNNLAGRGAGRISDSSPALKSLCTRILEFLQSIFNLFGKAMAPEKTPQNEREPIKAVNNSSGNNKSQVVFHSALHPLEAQIQATEKEIDPADKDFYIYRDRRPRTDSNESLSSVED